MQMRTPDKPHTCDKIFAVVRNPFDVFVSMFLFLNTASHSLISEEKINIAFQEEWDFNIKVMASAYKKFYEIVREIIAKDVPIYFIRYEDQITKAEPLLTELF